MLYKSQGSSDDTAYADIGFKNVLTVETYGPPGASDSGEQRVVELIHLSVQPSLYSCCCSGQSVMLIRFKSVLTVETYGASDRSKQLGLNVCFAYATQCDSGFRV